MLADISNITTVVGFIMYVVLTLIDRWPSIMEFKLNRQTVALACLVIALIAWGASYVVDNTKTVQQQVVTASTQSVADWNTYQKVPVINKQFINEKVVLDGKSFSGCTFKNVTFEFNGSAPFDIFNNTIDGSYILDSNSQSIRILLRFLKEFRYLNDKVEILQGRLS